MRSRQLSAAAPPTAAEITRPRQVASGREAFWKIESRLNLHPDWLASEAERKKSLL